MLRYDLVVQPFEGQNVTTYTRTSPWSATARLVITDYRSNGTLR
jgi:hypothetical protein